MKDYEEMAGSVLRRRDAYVARRRRQRKQLAAAIVCLTVTVGSLAVWRQSTVPAEDTAAGGILPGGAYVSEDVSDPTKAESAEAEKDTQMAGPADNGGDLDGDPAGYSIQKMISTFGETKMASDISVESGGVVFSDALTEAMELYGSEVKYQVVVELFLDGVAIDCADDAGVMEMERFAAEGYTVAFENYYDGYVDHNYFTLHATLEQLESFPASEDYGYCVMLYGERVETTGGSQNEVSETDFAPSATADAVPVR
jgi:hypothetical protein